MLSRLWAWLRVGLYALYRGLGWLWNLFGRVFIFCFWPWLIPFLLVFGPKDFWRGIREIWPDID